MTEDDFKDLELYFNNLDIDGRIDLVLRYCMPNWKNAIISDYEKQVVKHHESDKYPITDYGFGLSQTPYEETTDIMIEENLLFVNRMGELEPTAKAHRLFEKGGWLANIKQIEQDRQRERDNIDASIRTNNSVRDNQATQNFISKAAIFVAAMGAIGTLGQWLVPLDPKANNSKKPTRPKQGHCCCSRYTDKKIFEYPSQMADTVTKKTTLP